MNSGSVVPAVDVANPKAQAVYDTVVNAAGCSSSSDTLACLRGLSYEDFMRAANVSEKAICFSTGANICSSLCPDFSATSRSR